MYYVYQCTWCPSLNRCSTGTDRKRQEWIQSGCERTTIKEVDICPALGAKGNNYSSQQQVATPVNNSDRWISTNADSSKTNNQPSLDVKKAAFSHDEQQPKQTTTSFAIGILLPIIVIITLLMWVFYAYRNPHTKSGQLLIQVSLRNKTKCNFDRKCFGFVMRKTLLNFTFPARSQF